ncbi:interferon alpha-inducible protein 27-like protein 2 [Penaeus monodon]|uniref:interferon alpha-inducible protein 27-like protein 2 n=1 Tax=Penaeus monodon TaxID=6687 RepID=UPI0018A75F26|nr:interferon alpha-inducible protein 27-like protein 2 [Penaeus monodon]
MKLRSPIFTLLSVSSLSILAESSEAKQNPTLEECENDYSGLLATAAVGGAVAVAAPLVLPMLGFTSAGIAAGSWASSLMSAAATGNGGAVAAGSVVSVMQSVAAAGVGAAGKIGLASFGFTTGAGMNIAYEKAKAMFGGKKDKDTRVICV